MKRFFISFYVAFLAFGSIWFAIQFNGDQSWANGGALFSAVSGSLYFIGIYTFYRVPRTSKNLWGVAGFIFAGLIMVLSSLYNNPIPAHYIALFYAGLNLYFWDRYVNWYSVYSNVQLQLKEGDKFAPDSLVDVYGNTVSHNELKGKGLWMFYRGNWCPFCVAQVKEISKSYAEINNLGYQLYFVGSQSSGHSAALDKKIEANATFLTDQENAFAKKAGLLDKNGLPIGLEILGYDSDLVIPTIVVTDERNKIVKIQAVDNYRLRPEPQSILEFLKNIK